MEARKFPKWASISILTLICLLIIGIIIGVVVFLGAVINLVAGPVGQPQEGLFFQLALMAKTVFIWVWKYPLAAVLIVIIMIVAALGPGKKPSKIFGLH